MGNLFFTSTRLGPSTFHLRMPLNLSIIRPGFVASLRAISFISFSWGYKAQREEGRKRGRNYKVNLTRSLPTLIRACSILWHLDCKFLGNDTNSSSLLLPLRTVGHNAPPSRPRLVRHRCQQHLKSPGSHLHWRHATQDFLRLAGAESCSQRLLENRRQLAIAQHDGIAFRAAGPLSLGNHGRDSRLSQPVLAETGDL